jgi:hypothetical protein
MKQKGCVPVHFPVLVERRTAFVTARQCQSDPQLAEQIVRRALRRLEAWRERYADFFGAILDRRAASVIGAIARWRRATEC